MATVLACGQGAVLSHGSAAALWGLLRPIDGPVDVSVPSTSGRARRRGINLHRRVSLTQPQLSTLSTGDEQSRQTPLVTERHRIPVTSVPRTVDDLRGAVAPSLVRRARRQAELAGHRLDGESDRTRSDLERDFLRFCRHHDIPVPEVNVRVGRYEVDFLWRDARLIVETDGYLYHRGATAFENDHDRDLMLRRQGYAVHHYTGAQLRDHPAEVVAELGEVLRIPTRP